MTGAQSAFLDILKRLLRGETVKTADSPLPLASFAYSNGLIHVLGLVSDEPRLRKACMQEIAKSNAQTYAVQEILNVCEENGIDVLLLKGTCTRNRYPNPDLRSMGDIDLLIRSTQNMPLRKLLQSVGYEWHGENQKHDHFTRQPFIDIEVHREMVAARSNYAEYYKKIWEKCALREGYRFVYEMKLEDEFIFNIVHLAEHLKEGGVGIRLVMDVFVYDQMQMDRAYVAGELRKLQLLDFYRNVSRLAEKWFGDDPVDETPVLAKLEAYVLDGGLYGKEENHEALAVSGSRFSFFLSTCFPRYRDLRSAYPWLGGKPFLLPIAWCVRALRVVFQRKRSLRSEFDSLKRGDRALGQDIRQFYKDCGLDG